MTRLHGGLCRQPVSGPARVQHAHRLALAEQAQGGVEQELADRIAAQDRVAPASDHILTGPVTLMNSFAVNPDQDEAFCELWTKTARYFTARPGFISLRLRRAASADAPYRWVNVATWESEAHFRAAHGTGHHAAFTGHAPDNGGFRHRHSSPAGPNRQSPLFGRSPVTRPEVNRGWARNHSCRSRGSGPVLARAGRGLAAGV